jgi:glutathione S-transferase
MKHALYFAPGACSFVPHVGLELIKEHTGEEFEPRLVKLHKGESLTPEYLAMNPDGQVPVLEIDGKPLVQIVAICDYLDRYAPGIGLLAATMAERSAAISTLAWMNNTLHPTFTHVFMPQRFTDDAHAQASIKAFNTSKFRSYLQRLDAQASTRPAFWSGAQLGLIDAYCFTLLRWGGIAGISPGEMPHLHALAQRLMQHPVAQRVIARERIGLDTFKG